MVYLAIDTSAHVAVALVSADGAVLVARVRTEPRMHAELVSAMIQDALNSAGLAPRDVTDVIVGTGPAPFTGLRVGLVTGRVFALAVGARVHGVSSVDVLAVQAAQDLSLPPGTRVAVCTDARRREVYAAQYEVVAAAGSAGGTAQVSVVAGQEVLSPHDAAAAIPAGTVTAGAGVLLYPEQFSLSAGAPVELDPGVLGLVGRQRVLAGVPMPHEPLYLRRPDVTLTEQRKRVTT